MFFINNIKDYIKLQFFNKFKIKSNRIKKDRKN